MATLRSRRRYLRLVGAGALLGLAGCTENSPDGDDDDTGDDSEDGTDDDDGGTDDGTNDDGSGNDGGTDGDDDDYDDGTDDDGGTDDEDDSDGDDDTGNDDTDDDTGDENDGTDDDDGQSDSPRLRDVFTWETSYVMDIEADDFTGTWRFNDGDWLLTATSDGDTSETYSIGTDTGRDTYVVSDGQCFKTSRDDPGDDIFDPEDPADDDREYYASGRTTVDGEEVYVFDIEDGTYYVSVSTGYPVRFESENGENVVEFHSWGATDPISPPEMDCIET